MLKERWRVISRIGRVADNLLIIAAFFFAYYYRDFFLLLINTFALPFPEGRLALAPIQDYLIVLGTALPLYNAILSILGAYQSMRFSSAWKLFRQALVASLLVFLCEGSILFVLKLDLSRSFVGIFCALSGLAIAVERYIVLRYLRYWRLRGKNFRNLLIVGNGLQARKIYRMVNKQPELGIKVVGFVELEGSVVEGDFAISGSATARKGFGRSAVDSLPVDVVATAKTFESALKKHAVDEVIFTDLVKYFSVIDELAHIAVEEGVRVTLAADLFSLGIRQSETSYVGSIPLIHFQISPGDSGALALKRTIDIFVSSLGLLCLSPLMLFAALTIKLDSEGPVFFRQKRVGLNGRIFVLLKFRSMVKNAEEMLTRLREHNEMAGPVFKMKNDPRVTRVGRVIRRTSIDELPQLINVLRGDMSLVGPRPPLPEEVSLYVRKHRRRLSMRPGITCTWQVSGRNANPDFEKWMDLDLEYIDNWSLRRDLNLIVRTIPAVLSGSGAR